MNGHDFPEDFGQPDFDLRSDPDYLTYSARLDAESDYDNGIALVHGLLARRESGTYTTEAEVNAYRDAYQLCALKKICKDAGLTNVSFVDSF